ncbi:mercury(II) reductase [Calditrichota bacterium LG25]
MTIKRLKLKISGMTCEHCASSIEKSLVQAGVIEANISYLAKGGTVSIDLRKTTLDDVLAAVQSSGHYRVLDAVELNSGESSSARHLIIIGGGSAAFAAALQAHELEARVTMINDGLPIGGTCVNVGCVPSKILIRAAHDLHLARQHPFAGMAKTAKLVDFSALMIQVKEMVAALQKQKYIDVIKDLTHFEYIQGRAQIASPNTVEVNGKTIYGDAIIVASGASPSVPSIAGLEDVHFLTNESLYNLQTLPEHLIILGGSFIGLETAQMFSRFGSKVTIIERLPQILAAESADIAAELSRHLRNEGIEILTSARTLSVSETGGRVRMHIQTEDKEMELNGTHLFVATGRRGNTDNLTNDKLKLERNRQGFLKVDEYLQTNLPSIFAAGDVIGGHMFVYTAAMEGKLAALNALTDSKQKADYNIVPRVLFTDPQFAAVGYDQQGATEAGFSADTITLGIKHIPRFIAANEQRGFIQLTRERDSDQLLGARVIAPEGGELIMQISLGLKFGATVADLREMLHPYLTASEGVKLAAITFTKNLEQLSCCAT